MTARPATELSPTATGPTPSTPTQWPARSTRALRELSHDVVAAVASDELRGASDPELYLHATQTGRRIVTENIKDFSPLLLAATATGPAMAPLLLVPPRRFPRGHGDRTATIVAAIDVWLRRPDADSRHIEDWLTRRHDAAVPVPTLHGALLLKATAHIADTRDADPSPSGFDHAVGLHHRRRGDPQRFARVGPQAAESPD